MLDNAAEAPEINDSGSDSNSDAAQPEPSAIDRAYDEIYNQAENTEAEPKAAQTKESAKEDTDGKPADEVEEDSEDQAEDAGEVSAPASWSAADKQVFATLPPEAQAIIARRESERDRFVEQKSADVDKERQKYAGVDDVFNTVSQIEAFRGVPPQQALQQLAQIGQYAQQNPAEYVKWFTQQAGIDLQSLVAPGDQSDDYADPETQALKAEIQTLKQQLGSVQQHQTTSVQQQAQQAIQAFAADPQHKYFEQVKPQIGQLMSADPSLSLADAYKKAVWLNDDVRDAVIAEQTEAKAQAAKEAQAKQQKAALAKAKKMQGTQLTGSTEATPAKPATTREAIDRAYLELNGN